MFGIAATLLSQGVTWLAKGLMTAGKHKVVEYVKQKTGIDLSTGDLKPEDIAKLKQLELQNEQEIKKLYFELIKEELNHAEVMDQHTVDLVKTINATMIQQFASDDKFVRRARPFVLYVSGTCFGLLLTSMSICLLISPFIHNPVPLKSIIDSVANVISNPDLWWFATAVNGITSLTRGIEKTKRLKMIDPLAKAEQQNKGILSKFTSMINNS